MTESSDTTLYVITGPTASGKSALAVSLAEALGSEIISADSRQIYRGIPVVTAVPSQEERRRVPHHLVEILPLEAYYSASMFREDALRLIPGIMERTGSAVVCGGSVMYVDALCNGIDELPTVPPGIRNSLTRLHALKGDSWLIDRLERLDPDYASRVDRSNIKRVFHGVEISLTAGRPYSSLLSGKNVSRNQLPWKVVKIAVDLPREKLFSRINSRVEGMAASGLVDEIRSVSHKRHLNSLNTVGVKEIIRYLDGEWTLPEALARMAKNTRVYAKKQLTWLRRDSSVRWLTEEDIYSPDIVDRIISLRNQG